MAGIGWRICACLICVQHTVELLSLLSDDVETDDASPGENLKLRLKGIEEEEILPGFILCNAENLCHTGRTFDAQVSDLHCRAAITNWWFSLSISQVCPQCMSNFSRLLKLHWITHFYGQNASTNCGGNRMRWCGRSMWSKLPTIWEFFILSFKLMH